MVFLAFCAPENFYIHFSGYIRTILSYIKTETVAKEAEDTKQTGSDTYPGFDLVGVQIRDGELDGMECYGNPGSGLRFINVLSEKVYDEINGISGKTSSALKMQSGDDYEIQYNGKNVNGVDTTVDFRYVRNMKCSGVADHFDGENYRLFTAVITYKGLEGDALESAYATPFTARSYIRYYDANGLYRTYYNNYTGTELFNSINTSFADIRTVVEG